MNTSALRGILLLFFFCLLAGCATDKSRQDVPELRSSDLRDHVTWLASPELKGRMAGTKYEARAANYIADHFRDFGLEPGGDGDTYYQLFRLEGPVVQAMNAENQLSRNVIGIIPGTSNLEQFIIIGAHYDAQGMGGVISMDTGTEPAIHPGADDNASGTAGLLELARYFGEHSPERTLVFIAFSGEELGLLGSRYFVENSTLPRGEILAMINLDMIGRMENEKLSIMGTGTAGVWSELILAANQDSLEIRKVSSGSGASDHASFYEKDIPVLHYFAGSHPDYHRPGDTADKINYEGIVKITAHVQRVVSSLDSLPGSELSFTPTTRRETGQMPEDVVTLGLQPDYSYDGSGVRVDRVRSGEPAEKGGMEDGDIIFSLGGEPVFDIYDYMEQISGYSRGDHIEVQVIRNGNEIALEIVF